MKRTHKIILLSGIGLLTVLAIGAAAYIFIRPWLLPVYREGPQHKSERADFMVSTLVIGDQEYESDVSEFALEATASGFRRMIGRTDRGNRVYAVPGVETLDYVILSGFMFPEIIFRNTRLPARDLAELQMNELQILANQGTGPTTHKTNEAAIIEEVVERLTPDPGTIHPDQVQINSYKLMLFSREIPGLDFFANLAVNNTGEVYLSTRLAPDDWIPAGEALTGWVHDLGL